MYVLIVGDVVDGFVFIGPFEEHEDAVKYAEGNHKDDSWSVTALDEPNE